MGAVHLGPIASATLGTEHCFPSNYHQASIFSRIFSLISFRYIFNSKSHLWAEFIFLTSMGGRLASLAHQLLRPQGGHLPLVHHLRLLATDAGRLDRELGHPVDQPGGGAVAVERVASQVPGEGLALVEKRVMIIMMIIIIIIVMIMVASQVPGAGVAFLEKLRVGGLRVTR